MDCADDSAGARLLWKPGSHELVLIEMRGAASNSREFYTYAHAASDGQKFGFFIPQAPYLTTSAMECDSACAQLRNGERNHRPDTPDRAVVTIPDQGNLSRAAARITTLKQLARRGEVNMETRPPAVSEAMKLARRVLGESEADG